MTLAANINCNPFQIFDRDADEIIMLINFYIELGNERPNNPDPVRKEKRIRVNDKTATNGWF